MSKTNNKDFWNGPLTGSRIKSDDVKLPEMLIGYFIGPFGALLASGIFTSILQNYFTDVLKLNLTAFFDHSDRGCKPDRRSAY